MAERENVFTAMKRYLASMNKRIDDMGTKTSTLEEEIRKLGAEEAQERSKLSERNDSERTEIQSRIADLTSKLEQNQTQLMESVERLKQELSDFKSTTATRNDLESVKNSLHDDLAPLRDQKLDRSEFQDFVEKNASSMKDVFDELSGSTSFAEFATQKAESEPEPSLEAAVAESLQSASEEESSTRPSLQEQRREEGRKKKKWL